MSNQIYRNIENKTLECLSLQNIIIGYLNNLEVKANPVDIETALKASQEKMQEVLILVEKLEVVKEE